MADLVEMEVNFKNWKVPELKKYLQARGIFVSNKKKEELLELTEKAHELGLELTDDGESISDVVNAKLVTKDGTIPNPFNLYSDWSTDFSDAPKSLEGYRLHWDGHVYNLQRNKNIYFGHRIIKFSVKPTEREKTPLGNKPTYDGWITIHKGGVVLSAHFPCIGG